MNRQILDDLSRIQEILKPCIWFSGCAITRISSSWLCWGNLAGAVVWRDLQILKNLQKASCCQEGEERVCCLRGVWLMLLTLCVHLSTSKENKCGTQVLVYSYFSLYLYLQKSVYLILTAFYLLFLVDKVYLLIEIITVFFFKSQTAVRMMAGSLEIRQTAVWLRDIAVEVRRVVGCGLDVNVGNVCNPPYKTVWCHGKCETGPLSTGVCKQVGYLDKGSRQPALCTNNCGQAHDAKRAARGAGSCSKHVGVWVGTVVEVAWGWESLSSLFFYFNTSTASKPSWWFYCTVRPNLAHILLKMLKLQKLFFFDRFSLFYPLLAI